MTNNVNPGLNYHFITTHFVNSKALLNLEKRTGNDVKKVVGVGLEGSSRTGKSYDTAIFLCQYLNKYTGKRVIIGRDTLSSLKKTLYSTTLRKVWKEFNMPMSMFNKSATEITFNGNTITFIGVNDNIENAKGMESDLLWLNEAFSIPFDIAKQYIARCSEFFIFDYNPSGSKHWLYDMEMRDDYRLFKTLIFDNKFAPKNQVNEILSAAHPDVDDYELIKDKEVFKQRFKGREDWESFKQKNKKMKTANLYFWKVYGLGIRALSDDLVFTEIYRYEEEVKDYDWKIYGGDFGYKRDPTALVEIIKKGNKLYLRQLVYETGLLNPDIAKRILDEGYNDVISCWDKAEEKSIDELYAMGINAYAPDKPFIIWGIQKIQQFELYIHVDSEECFEEFSSYKYLKDNQGQYKRNSHGHLIPHDKDNHTIDATRYGLTYYYLDEAKENTEESEK